MKKRIFLHFALLLIVLAAAAQAQVVVVSSASFRQNQPVAAGSIATAFGTFPGVEARKAETTPLPKELAGVRVLVSGIECPLFYVSNSQINFQVPAALQPGIYEVRVTTGSSAQIDAVSVINAAPGLFTFFNTGNPPQSAALNEDGVTVNSESTPERRGRLVTLFGTGPGRLTQVLPDGVPTPLSPLIRTVSEPVVYIAGVQAKVEFSGLTPTAVGLWQINVRIPDFAFIRGRVPVVVFMDGVDSNEVSIYVAP